MTARHSSNVEVVPLSRYARNAVAAGGLQLGFAAVDPTELRRGVQELAIALEELSKATRM